MFLKTWSAATWLDEAVFIATVLAVLLADAGPSRAVMVNCSLKQLECDWVQATQRGSWAGRLGGADWAARDRYVSLMLKHIRA